MPQLLRAAIAVIAAVVAVDKAITEVKKAAK